MAEILEEELAGAEATLHECTSCEFRYFDPSLAGSGRFYERLEDPTYYAAEKPEFAAALDCAARFDSARVLDVGCGGGAFLDLAKARGYQTSGTELNPDAVARVVAKGHSVILGTLDDVPLGAGPFDLITLFQVMEHVPQPVEVAMAARRLLSPDGILFIAVPHDHGLPGLARLSPYQWPPHHISRWRKRDLVNLARQSGFEVESFGSDPLIGSQIRHYWKLRQATRHALGYPVSRFGGIAAGLASGLMKCTGANRLNLPGGHSIWAILRPASS